MSIHWRDKSLLTIDEEINAFARKRAKDKHAQFACHFNVRIMKGTAIHSFVPLFPMISFLVILFGTFFPTNAQRTFHIDTENNEFLKDGQVFRFVSGEMHYFRVPTELWRDRLRKMKFGGLNVVQT